MSGRGLPRALEAAAAAAGLAVLSPLLLGIAAAVALDSGFPVLFRQARVGRAGRVFTLLKFRSMRAGAGPEVTARGDSRVTRVGALLRKTKLDELPQLWNVLVGDMSLVGARPEVPSLVDLSNPLWRRILEARPGITDPVAVRLRDEEELLASSADPRGFYVSTLQPWKLAGYVEYQERRTWRTDVEVLSRTVLVALRPGAVPPVRLEEITRAVTREHGGAA
jgi:lipopolysaccharide/colanic/teichoic acid biosynthesis glycosyltransferase